MVNSMHVRRHDDAPQQPVDARRHDDVAMVEDRHDGGQDRHGKDRQRRRAETADHDQFRTTDEQVLERMVTDGGCAVDVELRMMDLVHAPKKRRRVRQPVEQVSRAVDREHRDDE